MPPAKAMQEFQSSAHAPAPAAAERDSTKLVFFLVGVTFTDIAALNHVATHDTASTFIIIGATKIVNGTRIESLKALS